MAFHAVLQGRRASRLPLAFIFRAVGASVEASANGQTPTFETDMHP